MVLIDLGAAKPGRCISSSQVRLDKSQGPTLYMHGAGGIVLQHLTPVLCRRMNTVIILVVPVAVVLLVLAMGHIAILRRTTLHDDGGRRS